MSLKTKFRDVPRNEYKKLKIYIAGPMRGYENLNHDAFNRVEAILKDKLVYDPINPAKLDKEHGLDPAKEMTKEDLKHALRRDVDAIFEADGIYMLRGWERSEGARMEHALAIALSMSISYEL